VTGKASGNLRVFLIGSVGASVVLFVLLRPQFLARAGQGSTASLLYGLIACLLVLVASFFLLRRAIRLSDRSFLVAFLGGIVGRFFLFAAAVAVAFLLPGLDGRAVAVAILVAFVPLTALEVVCVIREGKAGRAGAAPVEGGEGDG